MGLIEPNDINTKQHFWNAFDNREREISARWIVSFCQERGCGWEPFTLNDIEQFYNTRGGYVNFRFNGLVDPQYGIEKVSDEYHIKHEFIVKCYLVSPAKGEHEE